MTLDFKKMIRNLVKKECDVHHWEGNAEIFKKEELPEQVSGKIRSVFGETFLEDANYLLFFSSQTLNKEEIEKYVFKVCNSALGRSANNLTESDIKMLDFGTTASQPVEEPTSIDKADLSGEDTDEVNDAAIADVLGDDLDDDDEEIDSDGAEEDTEEDTPPEDNEENLDESVSSPSAGEKFCFLKITMK